MKLLGVAVNSSIGSLQASGALRAAPAFALKVASWLGKGLG